MPSEETKKLLADLEVLSAKAKAAAERPNHEFDRAVATLDRIAAGRRRWPFRKGER